eukprot:scaffold223607_cov35-Tisochrysis_lutea.AAC.1
MRTGCWTSDGQHAADQTDARSQCCNQAGRCVCCIAVCSVVYQEGHAQLFAELLLITRTSAAL